MEKEFHDYICYFLSVSFVSLWFALGCATAHEASSDLWVA